MGLVLRLLRLDVRRAGNFPDFATQGSGTKNNQPITLKENEIKLPVSILILGRRWFDRRYGNTYNTAQIIIDGNTVHSTPIQYGYGDHYATIASEWLDASGLVPPRPADKHGYAPAGWQFWRDDLKINYSYQAIDVQRKKDL